MRWCILLLLPLSGCVTPCHRAFEMSQAGESVETAEIPNRGRVHVVILNGSDPFVSMTPLRTKLNEAGFTKVSSGGLFYTGTFEKLIREVHADDAEARFVIAGYGLGIASADAMATRLINEGIPVDAVIALSPRTIGTPAPANVKRIVVRSKASPMQIADEKAYTLANDGSIAADDAVHELVVRTVIESCEAIPVPVEPAVAVLALIDDPAPLPRPRPVEVHQPKPVTGILTGQPK